MPTLSAIATALECHTRPSRLVTHHRLRHRAHKEKNNISNVALIIVYSRQWSGWATDICPKYGFKWPLNPIWANKASSMRDPVHIKHELNIASSPRNSSAPAPLQGIQVHQPPSKESKFTSPPPRNPSSPAPLQGIQVHQPPSKESSSPAPLQGIQVHQPPSKESKFTSPPPRNPSSPAPLQGIQVHQPPSKESKFTSPPPRNLSAPASLSKETKRSRLSPRNLCSVLLA